MVASLYVNFTNLPKASPHLTIKKILIQTHQLRRSGGMQRMSLLHTRTVSWTSGSLRAARRNEQQTCNGGLKISK